MNTICNFFGLENHGPCQILVVDGSPNPICFFFLSCESICVDVYFWGPTTQCCLLQIKSGIARTPCLLFDILSVLFCAYTHRTRWKRKSEEESSGENDQTKENNNRQKYNLKARYHNVEMDKRTCSRARIHAPTLTSTYTTIKMQTQTENAHTYTHTHTYRQDLIINF